MELLQYNGYEGTAELDMDRKVCRGKILFINDLVTYEADSPAALQAEFEAAVDDYIETCRAIDKEPQKPLKGVFNVRVVPALHKQAVIRAMKEGTSLNDVVAKALDAYVSIRTDFNHNIKLTVDMSDKLFTTVSSIASAPDMQWVTKETASSVH